MAQGSGGVVLEKINHPFTLTLDYSVNCLPLALRARDEVRRAR
jgi:hypothetical protein